MFKMKMMAFFKNPAIRNSLIILLVVITTIGLINWPKSDAAEQISVSFRAAIMNVKVGNKDIEMPEIGPNQNDQTTKEKKYNNVYCIDEGTSLSYAVYNKELNLYSAESTKCFKNYNSALWLIDNMYISTASNNDELLNYFANMLTSPEVKKNVSSYGNITSDSIKTLNKTVGNGTDSENKLVNRNLIEVIEQIALWNYTNNANNSDASKYDKLVNSGFSGKNITANDQNTCKYVYYALKYLANKNSDYKFNGTVNNVISLDATEANINSDKKQVGARSCHRQKRQL